LQTASEFLKGEPSLIVTSQLWQRLLARLKFNPHRGGQRRSAWLPYISFFCIGLLLVVGCGRPPSNPTASSPAAGSNDRLVIGVKASRVSTLDPADAYSTVSGNLLYNLGDRLYTYESGTNKLKPQLATALPTVSDDRLLYTIPLRKDVVFHDGTPFNAKAMEFSLQRFIKNEGGPSALLGNVVQTTGDKGQSYGITATGDYELTIELKQPFAAFSDLLAFSGMVAVSPTAYKDAVGKDAAGNGKFKPTEFVGTGPYKLEKFENDTIQLTTFDKYWGEKPQNKGVILQFYPSGANLFNAFRTGTVDMTYQSLDPVQIEALEKQAKDEKSWQVFAGSGNGITYLTLNTKTPEFKNPKVRQAFAAMIDRDLLNQRVFRGQVEPLYTLIPNIFDVSQPVLKQTKTPDQVKALLKEAGYSESKPLNLAFWHRSNVSSDVAAASTIKAAIERDYGTLVKVEPKSIESTTAYDNLDKGTYPIFMLDWSGDFYDPDNYIEPFLACEKGSVAQGCTEGETKNQGSFFYSDRANQLIQQSRQETDPAKRKKLFEDLQTIVAEEVPFIPLWQNKDYVFAQTNLQGVRLESTQQFSFASLTKS
jgi:peptide/nickel transport system substrate-binding protein